MRWSLACGDPRRDNTREGRTLTRASGTTSPATGRGRRRKPRAPYIGISLKTRRKVSEGARTSRHQRGVLVLRFELQDVEDGGEDVLDLFDAHVRNAAGHLFGLAFGDGAGGDTRTLLPT